MSALWVFGIAGLAVAATGIGYDHRNSGSWVLGFWSAVAVVAGIAL